MLKEYRKWQECMKKNKFSMCRPQYHKYMKKVRELAEINKGPYA